MSGRFSVLSVLFILLLPPPSWLLGQNVPNGPNPPAMDQTLGPRRQRAARERVVAALGPDARDFAETYGDDAVAAASACKREAALALVQFHNSGGLAGLPRPRDLLRVIATPNNGSDVAS